jgi:hypothetical protein
MPNSAELPAAPPLEPLIFTLRGHRVILDADLARLYEVTTLTSGETLTQVRQLPTTGVRLANLQAWLARYEQRRADAQIITEVAATLSPGDAAVWMERALLAGEQGDTAAMRAAIHRALHWAPTWPDIQSAALRLVAGYGQAAMPKADAQAIITTFLAQDRGQPPWFFDLAAALIGKDTLSEKLTVAGPRLAAAGERWLASQGNVQHWTSVRQRLGTHQRPSAWMTPIADALYGPNQWTLALPGGADARRHLADQLQQAGLPIPADLRGLIQNDGALYAPWAEPINLLDNDTHELLTNLLRSELHRPWVKIWSDRLLMIQRAQRGDTTAIGRDSDPRIIAWIAGKHPGHPVPPAVSQSEQTRAELLLQRWQEWEWTVINPQTKWSWYYHTSTQPAVVTTPTWSALIIDGNWLGWIRGTQQIGALMSPGLHRVVVLSP